MEGTFVWCLPPSCFVFCSKDPCSFGRGECLTTKEQGFELDRRGTRLYLYQMCDQEQVHCKLTNVKSPSL